MGNRKRRIDPSDTPLPETIPDTPEDVMKAFLQAARQARRLGASAQERALIHRSRPSYSWQAATRDDGAGSRKALPLHISAKPLTCAPQSRGLCNLG